MQLVKKHTNIALAYFLLVGLIGVFLRLFFIFSIPADFRFIVHTHSHVALLGWVYIALITIIYKLYFSEVEKTRYYKLIIWFTNICILGMLFSFPFQGYALFSIIFSTLFLITSYWMGWFIFKHTPIKFKNTLSYVCIKASIWYMLISSIGPWAVGGIMSTLGSTSIWYKLAIYFYLHFQYNGWFILALIGILFYLIEQLPVKLDKKRFNIFFYLLNLSIILSFFLSVLWTKPPIIFYILAALGAILQVVAFLYFFRIIRSSWPSLKKRLSTNVRKLLKLSGLLLFVKIQFQLISAIPYFADLVFIYKDFVIGYLHWTFLGVVSLCLLTFLEHFKFIKLNGYLISLYLFGFIFSEFLIFYNAVHLWLRWPAIPEHTLLLVVISAFIPISVGFLLVNNLTSKLKL